MHCLTIVGCLQIEHESWWHDGEVYDGEVVMVAGFSHSCLFSTKGGMGAIDSGTRGEEMKVDWIGRMTSDGWQGNGIGQ